jgi:hypothetical protein
VLKNILAKVNDMELTIDISNYTKGKDEIIAKPKE